MQDTQPGEIPWTEFLLHFPLLFRSSTDQHGYSVHWMEIYGPLFFMNLIRLEKSRFIWRGAMGDDWD
jgi:hypothetical protein